MANLKLSLVMATMATMSTAMLGLGQQSFALPMMTLAAAAASVLVTDHWGWFSLNRVVANLAMLLAAFFSLYGFLESDSQQQLWSIANLLIYVQMVLLFQQKNRRVYGQLAMFSLLQVVVAALLNDGLEFGLLLACYMMVALLGFVLFFVYREVDRVGMLTRRRYGLESVETSPEDAGTGSDSLPVIQVAEHGESLNRRIATSRILPPIMAVVAATAVFTAVFFYSTPRTGGANWERGLAGGNLVGFSPEISFHEMGRLLENHQRVMRVSFANVRTGEPYTVIGQPYLRGVVLTKYVDGRWLQEVRSSKLPLVRLEPPPSTRDLVRQDVLLEPTGGNRLFSMFPVYSIAQTPSQLRIEPRTRHLLRVDVDHRETSTEYRYVIATTAFRFGAQLPVIPHPNRMRTPAERARMVRLNRFMRNINSRDERFPRLVELASRIVREAAPDGNNYERARALEAFFLDNEDFQYTLDMREVRARRRPDLDPVEDFVANHRRGHCQYFASALTLMLRSQGIPARMVIGYRPSEFNYVGNYYVVRQRDAHAWVEAYLEPEEIPTGMLYPQEQHAGGGWLRLDPTPADPQENAPRQADLLDRASKSLDYARWLWSDYVLRLTEQRQRNAMLAPLVPDRKTSLASLFDMGAWGERFQRLLALADPRRLLRGEFSWRSALVLLGLASLLLLSYRLARLLGPAWRRLRGWTSYGRSSSRATVGFYRQLEATLARRGWHREPNQTQRQFAADAARRLAGEQGSVAHIPRQIVDLFYQVRFGHRAPDRRQEQAVNDQLRQLAEALGKRASSERA